MTDDFWMGLTVGLAFAVAIAVIFGVSSAKWYLRWSKLLDNVRFYLRNCGNDPVNEHILWIEPFDLYKLSEREHEEGYPMLPRREHVRLSTRKPR